MLVILLLLYDGWFFNFEEKNIKSLFLFEWWVMGGVFLIDFGVNVVLFWNGDIVVYDWLNGEWWIGCKNNFVELLKKNIGFYRVFLIMWGCVICEVKFLFLVIDRVVGSCRCFLRCCCLLRLMYFLVCLFIFIVFVCCLELWCILCLKKIWFFGLWYWCFVIELVVFV